MTVRNVLVIYKKSAYQMYVVERKNPLFVGATSHATAWDLQRLKQAHAAHVATLSVVERVLNAKQMPYRLIHRALRHDYAPYDVVIAVGGDGTFLEAARGVTRQFLLGVNSDPKRSAGVFCRANGKTFARIMDALMNDGIRTQQLHRMQLVLNGQPLEFSVLNDILVAHENPAAMSRYELAINGITEEQRSSGIWMCTAAGSTAAMKSAGGRVMPWHSHDLQYMPREVYCAPGTVYYLAGSVVSPPFSMRLRSLMRQGMIYVDGEHFKVPFRYGDVLEVNDSPYPLRMIDGVVINKKKLMTPLVEAKQSP